MIIAFWVIGLTLVIVVSFFLAWRSMKDFKEVPHNADIAYSLYLIKNPSAINETVLTKIHQFVQGLNGIISFERLIKGGERVLVIYCPTSLKLQVPELDLLELEDYLEPIFTQNSTPYKTTLNQVLGWIVGSKNNSKKPLTVKNEFLMLLDLKDDQKFFLQIVCQPVLGKKNESPEAQFSQFQTTIRVLVADPNPNDRVELAKKMDSALFDATGLIKQARQQTNQSIYEDYIKRVFIPKEVSKNFLHPQEILSLIR